MGTLGCQIVAAPDPLRTEYPVKRSDYRVEKVWGSVSSGQTSAGACHLEPNTTMDQPCSGQLKLYPV